MTAHRIMSLQRADDEEEYFILVRDFDDVKRVKKARGLLEIDKIPYTIFVKHLRETAWRPLSNFFDLAIQRYIEKGTRIDYIDMRTFKEEIKYESQ